MKEEENHKNRQLLLGDSYFVCKLINSKWNWCKSFSFCPKQITKKAKKVLDFVDQILKDLDSIKQMHIELIILEIKNSHK